MGGGDPLRADILAQPGLAELDGGELLSGPSVETDEQILDWSPAMPRPRCTRRAHAMGPVVDPATMRVRGGEGLRVVDASVFPSGANAHIHARG